MLKKNFWNRNLKTLSNICPHEQADKNQIPVEVAARLTLEDITSNKRKFYRLCTTSLSGSAEWNWDVSTSFWIRSDVADSSQSRGCLDGLVSGTETHLVVQSSGYFSVQGFLRSFRRLDKQFCCQSGVGSPEFLCSIRTGLYSVVHLRHESSCCIADNWTSFSSCFSWKPANFPPVS